MGSGAWSSRRAALLLAASAGLVLAAAPAPAPAPAPATATAPAPPLTDETASVAPPRTYAGYIYGEGLLASPPTAQKPQSKLWFHDDAWWALMLSRDGAGVRIHELMPDHSWRPTLTVVDPEPLMVGDALSTGDVLNVVGRGRDLELTMSRFSYDETTREYLLQPGFPVAITRGGSDDATVAQDGLGRLWVAWTTSRRLLVTHSGPTGLAWVEPFTPKATGVSITQEEIASLVAFDDSIGVMWSDQTNDAFHFATHQDADPDDVWASETPLAGPNMADDHINLKVVDGDPHDRLVAVVKTSQGDAAEAGTSPLIVVMVRTADGVWTTAVAGTVADQMTRPVVLVDRGNQAVYLFMASPAGGGTIYVKSSLLDELAFVPGHGERFIFRGAAARLDDPTTTKQAVDAGTGAVVLASDLDADSYSHGEMQLPLPASGSLDLVDETPPTPPSSLSARSVEDGVSLTWDAASDGERWWAAEEGAPVAGYAVFRDGVEVGTTDLLSFVDRPPRSAASHRYAVEAIDLAGNRSERTEEVGVLASTAVAAPAPPWWLYVGAGGVSLVTLLAVRQLRSRRADDPPPEPVPTVRRSLAVSNTSRDGGRRDGG